MHFDLSFLKDLAAIFALVLINGIFVAAEFAMIRINPVHFSNADGRRKFGSRTALRLVEEMELSLSSLQFGITVSSILLGWFGVQILAEAILEGVDSLGFSNYVYTQPAAIAISLTWQRNPLLSGGRSSCFASFQDLSLFSFRPAGRSSLF